MSSCFDEACLYCCGYNWVLRLLLYLCNLQEGSKCFILFILAELRRVKSAKMLGVFKLYSEEDNSHDLENIE